MIDLLLCKERNLFPTLSGLSEKDISSIWANVSAYIECQMTLQKGVHMEGLGKFTFSRQKLDVGSKFITIQRPIFLLAEKLVQSQGLKQVWPLAAAMHVPVVQLNYTAVSQESPFNRDVVEGCVRETLLLLQRALASKYHTFLAFQGIGVLYFKNNKVRMKFNRDFINAIDGTGRLLIAFSHRPGTSVSLMTGKLSSLQRPQTSVTLPSVRSPEPGKKMDGKPGVWLTPAPAESDRTEKDTIEDPQPQQSKSHRTLLPAKVNGVSLSEALNPTPPPTETTDKLISSILPPEGSPRAEEPHLSKGCTGHTRAGQELCYLCMQRAQRNVPLYLREERLAQEKAQEIILLFKEQQKDQLYLHKEQANKNEKRDHAKQVAAFNLQVSEALKEEKAICSQYHSSFIFPERPLTPPREIKQRCYFDELQGQMVQRSQHKTQSHQGRLLLEHLEQAQLAHEIALQKAQQFQQKQQRVEHYQRALDAQVEDSMGLPEHQPDNLGFGRIETSASTLESRERAQKVFQEQLNAATQKREEEVSSRLARKTEEKEMLNRTRRELILDRISRFEKMQNLRVSLEDTWRRSAHLKHQRDDEEKKFLRSGAHLLIDQCEQYRRCYQCKRKTSNCGQSNIWKESHYIPGARHMI